MLSLGIGALKRHQSTSSMSAHLLKGVQLVNAKGETKDGEEAVQGKVFALYFAADWCPDCRDFQPTLNKFYADVNQSSAALEIVFVGSDDSDSDQNAHFSNKQGAWWAIPFANEFRNDLKRKYGVCAGKEHIAVRVTKRVGGIPSLVFVQPNGELIDLDGVGKIEKEGAAAFDAFQKAFTS